MMKISLYFAPSLIMEKSPACRVLQHLWHDKHSWKASAKTSHRSPGEGKEPHSSTVENREMLDVDTDTKNFNWLTGEYHVIAEETTSDPLITSLTLTRSAFMLPFSPQLVHKLEDSQSDEIKVFKCIFSQFFPFFWFVVMLTELPALSLSLSSVLQLIKGHCCWDESPAIF